MWCYVALAAEEQVEVAAVALVALVAREAAQKDG
jgi:hypothetical protein